MEKINIHSGVFRKNGTFLFLKENLSKGNLNLWIFSTEKRKLSLNLELFVKTHKKQLIFLYVLLLYELFTKW